MSESTLKKVVEDIKLICWTALLVAVTVIALCLALYFYAGNGICKIVGDL
jgi:hypothetical protein